MTYYFGAASTYAVAIIFPLLCAVAVALRFWARRLNKAEYGIDDWMALASLLPIVGSAIILVIGDAYHIIGWNTKNSTRNPSPSYLQSHNAILDSLVYAFVPISNIATGVIRLTLILLYRRIFIGPRFKTISSILTTFTILWTVAFALGGLFVCGSHFSAFWGDIQKLQEYCSAFPPFYASMTVTDAALDITVFILPIPPTLKLQMGTSQKMLAILVFALGIFSIAAGLTRMVLFIEILENSIGSAKPIFGSPGFGPDPWATITVALWWSYVEIGVGGLTSNMPPIFGLLRHKRQEFASAIYRRLSFQSLRAK